MAVVGLRGGSSVTGGLANVAVRDWSANFTFVIGDHRYWRPSSFVQFLSPGISKLQLIDATILEPRLEIEDGDELFDSVLEAAGGGGIAVDSVHRRIFEGICIALCNSELYRSSYPELGNEVTMENVTDRLMLLPAMRHLHRSPIHCVTFLRLLISSRRIERSAFFHDLRDSRRWIRED
jgi:hypothetical protein